MPEDSQRIVWTRQNLRELPKFRDGLSYLYLEHARIEVQDRSITCLGPGGAVDVPVAALGVLLLGPGTTVTHAAMRALADGGCSVLWVGERGMRLYASGGGESRSSRRLQQQVRLWHDEASRLRVVRAMYALRFRQKLPEHLTLRQIRGMEGARVRDTYAAASRESGVPWSGRTYQRERWGGDPVNRGISAGNACLYGLAHAAILSGGYSPALGFIHTGKQLSFVYDIADLYKIDVVVPIAFEAVAALPESIEGAVRSRVRQAITRSRLLERMMADLHRLMDADPEDEGEFDTDPAKPGDLWDPQGDVEGGVDHGRDRAGKRAAEPEG